MSFRKTIAFLFFQLCLAMGVEGIQEKAAEKGAFFLNEKYDADLDLTSFNLKNGMKVALKPTPFESDEIFIKIAAFGGYSSLNNTDRPSGELAASIAWESGFNNLTSDQVSVVLYEHSLELSVKIEPFMSVIEGSCTKSELLPLLKCIVMIFEQQNFTKEGLKVALEGIKKGLNKRPADYEMVYEDIFMQTNTGGINSFIPLTETDLTRVDLRKAEKFFHQCFDTPSRFSCVIVGSFDVSEVKKDLKKTLGNIEEKSSLEIPPPPVLKFPPGITEKIVKFKGRSECLARITFPLEKQITEKTVNPIEFMCQVIEARLRNKITESNKNSHGIDVAYEFPLYPYLNNPWILISFKSSEKEVSLLKQLILRELQILQSEGVSIKEYEQIKKLQIASKEFWLKDNFYWLSMLANFSMWDWSFQYIKPKEEGSISEINTLLKQAFSLSNYSVIIAKPEKK